MNIVAFAPNGPQCFTQSKYDSLMSRIHFQGHGYETDYLQLVLCQIMSYKHHECLVEYVYYSHARFLIR